MNAQVEICNRNAQVEANKLEAMFTCLPGVVQDVLYEPYSWMDDKLRMVAGNPEELLTAGSTYESLARAVTALQQQAQGDVKSLLVSWQGEDATAYAERMAELDETIGTLADSLAKMPELLESGAQACVDGANMIVDLVVSLIMFVIGTAVINGALAVITAGISAAAWVAEVSVKAFSTMAEVLQVVQKVAKVLQKVAEIFQKIAELLRAIEGALKKIALILKATKAVQAEVSGLDKLAMIGVFGAEKAVVSKGISAVTDGHVNIPGGVGKLISGAGDYKGGWDAASDAQDVASGAQDQER